jgi:hypothetical protein
MPAFEDSSPGSWKKQFAIFVHINKMLKLA